MTRELGKSKVDYNDGPSVINRAVLRADIKDARKVFTYKKQIAELHEKLRKQKEKARAEEARAEYAERQVRQIAAERDIWKHRALEAEAELKSAGRAAR